MKKAQREQVRRMFDNHCAYCGKLLDNIFHIDHIKPIYRNCEQRNIKGSGKDTLDNMFPACPRCNRWKTVMSVEEFRSEISKQVDRLRERSPQFRIAEDFGMIEGKTTKIVFYFETKQGPENETD